MHHGYYNVFNKYVTHFFNHWTQVVSLLYTVTPIIAVVYIMNTWSYVCVIGMTYFDKSLHLFCYRQSLDEQVEQNEKYKALVDKAVSISYNVYRIVQYFGGANFWRMKLENTFGWYYFGGLAITELALLFKVETLKGKFLAVTDKSAKIFPLQNFALYVITPHLTNHYFTIYLKSGSLCCYWCKHARDCVCSSFPFYTLNCFLCGAYCEHGNFCGVKAFTVFVGITYAN